MRPQRTIADVCRQVKHSSAPFFGQGFSANSICDFSGVSRSYVYEWAAPFCLSAAAAGEETAKHIWALLNAAFEPEFFRQGE